jgi:FAD-dependent urate hydroxylase
MITRVNRAGRGFALRLDDGDYVTARRVVLACGIAPFENMPSGFDHLPTSLVSHTGHHDDPGRFAGKRVAVVGGGQSAFESAVLMNERGAQVELIARGQETVFLRSWSPLHLMPRRLGEVVYAPTDVGPLWYSRLVATPALFTKLPRETQHRIAQRSIRPACSYFVKVRVEGVRVTKATEVTSAELAGDGLVLTLSDGTKREVDHLMFGTGYKVNVNRYPFMSEGLLSDLNVVDGFPVLRHGFESSIPNLHFLGAPAARSFGPIMRFVSGSWYGGTRLAQAVPRQRRGSAARRRRAAGGS